MPSVLNHNARSGSTRHPISLTHMTSTVLSVAEVNGDVTLRRTALRPPLHRATSDHRSSDLSEPTTVEPELRVVNRVTQLTRTSSAVVGGKSELTRSAS